MNKTPIEIKRLETKGLAITWSDGQTVALPSEFLRRNCPCAGCRESRGDQSHSSPLTPKKAKSLMIVDSSSEEQTRLEEIWGVGNYALGIRWGDGHSTGIYTFKELERLGSLDNIGTVPIIP